MSSITFIFSRKPGRRIFRPGYAFLRLYVLRKEFCDFLRGNLDILGISECGKFGVFLISKPLSVSTMALAIDWLKSARECLRRFFM